MTYIVLHMYQDIIAGFMVTRSEALKINITT